MNRRYATLLVVAGALWATACSEHLVSLEVDVDEPSPSVVNDFPAATTLVTVPRSTATPVRVRKVGLASVAQYRGIVGKLGLNERVAEPVAEPPAATPGRHPLTGLAGPKLDRPAALVKIDNTIRAIPQLGLEKADIVYEEIVEGATTRLLAVFHSQSATVLPVRSGRTTDIGIMTGYGTPMFLYSGANTVTDSLIRENPAVFNHSFDTTTGYIKNRQRRAPWNLSTDLDRHWAAVQAADPPPQFSYRSAGERVDGEPSPGLSVNYWGNKVSWNWDGTRYVRNQRGAPHTSGGVHLNAANVVVVETERVSTGMVDSIGTAVPEYVFVGTGKATVYTAGVKVEGVWTRPSLADVATLTLSESGAEVKLTPGVTWVQMVEKGSNQLR